MNIYHKASSFLLLALLLVFSLVYIFFVTNISFAEGNNSNSGTNYSTDSNSVPATSGDKNIYLRKPLLPGEKTVKGDREDGAFGILAEYISMIYRYVLALGSIIAVLVIMFSGFQIMTSGSNTEAIGEAKTMITKTLMGIAMLFLAGLFLYSINPNFYVFGGGNNTGGSSGSYSNSSNNSSSDNSTNSGSSNSSSNDSVDVLDRNYDSNQ